MRKPSRSRHRLATAVLAGFALSALAAGAACLAKTSASPATAWQGGWGSAQGWWGPGWWGTGRYLAKLPWNYQSFHWHGKVYYFGGASFYAWNGDAAKFEEVTPPIGFNQPLSPYVKMSQGIPKLSDHLFVYPQTGQSPAQLARDQSECLTLASAKKMPASAPAEPAAKPAAKPVATGGPGRRPARGGKFGRPGAHERAPIPSGPPVETLTAQHAVFLAEAACLEKRHYTVR